MERLTKRLSNGATSWNYQSDCYGEDETRNKVFRSVHRQNACEKLAAYEDTGLEPEDIKRAFNEAAVLKLAGQALGITPDRLRELAQTDKDGKIKAYIVDSFYCDICQKRHARTKEIEVYLTRNAAEAALRREQDG